MSQLPSTLPPPGGIAPKQSESIADAIDRLVPLDNPVKALARFETAAEVAETLAAVIDKAPFPWNWLPVKTFAESAKKRYAKKRLRHLLVLALRCLLDPNFPISDLLRLQPFVLFAREMLQVHVSLEDAATVLNTLGVFVKQQAFYEDFSDIRKERIVALARFRVDSFTVDRKKVVDGVRRSIDIAETHQIALDTLLQQPSDDTVLRAHNRGQLLRRIARVSSGMMGGGENVDANYMLPMQAPTWDECARNPNARDIFGEESLLTADKILRIEYSTINRHSGFWVPVFTGHDKSIPGAPSTFLNGRLSCVWSRDPEGFGSALNPDLVGRLRRYFDSDGFPTVFISLPVEDEDGSVVGVVNINSKVDEGSLLEPGEQMRFHESIRPLLHILARL